MKRILAIDLGKFKSVTCLLDTATNNTEFWTMSTDRQYLLISPAKWIARAASTNGAHVNCAAHWSKRPG